MSHAMALCVAEERRDLIDGGGSGDSDRPGVADPRRQPSAKAARCGFRLAECDGNMTPRGRALLDKRRVFDGSILPTEIMLPGTRHSHDVNAASPP